MGREDLSSLGITSSARLKRD
jgi:hypothetical protein